MVHKIAIDFIFDDADFSYGGGYPRFFFIGAVTGYRDAGQGAEMATTIINSRTVNPPGQLFRRNSGNRGNRIHWFCS